MTTRRSRWLAAVLSSCAALATPLAAQDAPTELPLPVADANNQIWLTSKVLPDHRVTFQIKAPTVAEAQLLLGDPSAGEKVYPMAKDKDGV